MLAIASYGRGTISQSIKKMDTPRCLNFQKKALHALHVLIMNILLFLVMYINTVFSNDGSADCADVGPWDGSKEQCAVLISHKHTNTGVSSGCPGKSGRLPRQKEIERLTVNTKGQKGRRLRDQAGHSHLRWSWGAAGGRLGSPVLGWGLWGRPLRAHTSRRPVCPSAEELRRVEPTLYPHCPLLLLLLLPQWAKWPGCHPPEPPQAQPEPPLELRSPSASAKSTGMKGWGVSQNHKHTNIKHIKHEESFQHKGLREVQVRASSCWDNIVKRGRNGGIRLYEMDRSYSQGGFNT